MRSTRSSAPRSEHFWLPDPSTFGGDSDYVRTRWTAAPAAALTAEVDGEVAGSNFVTGWGSFGFFGSADGEAGSVGNEGVAQQLLGPTMEMLDGRAARNLADAFAYLVKHAALYQKFGFWPRFLTAVMSKLVAPAGSAKPPDHQVRARG